MTDNPYQPTHEVEETVESLLFRPISLWRVGAIIAVLLLLPVVAELLLFTNFVEPHRREFYSGNDKRPTDDSQSLRATKEQ